MKHLLLARHAKSSWDLSGLSDHDRPLNERGERDVPRMGQALAQRGVKPDLIVSSTANRALTTAEGLAGEFGMEGERLRSFSDLYLAAPSLILRVIQGLDESEDCVLLVGHNPGMHEAASLLDTASSVSSFPTLAVARFEIDVEFWGEVEWGAGFLVELLTPKTLEE
ncbi:MAG: histidine phosphatase family protein [Verrucomicrobiales bacterium]|nr:histidine phosphatase family protein [Verrucomicrobiales bacterium]